MHILARDELAEVAFALAPIWVGANATPFSMLYPIAASRLERVDVTREMCAAAAKPVYLSGAWTG